MKTQTIATALIAFAALGSGAAFAEETYGHQAETGFVSTLTRAEVQAQVLQARKDGGLQIVGDADKAPAFVSTAERSQIRAEAVQSVRNHVLAVDQLGS